MAVTFTGVSSDTLLFRFQALSEYDTEVKRLREEALDAKKILEEDLDEEKRHSQELQVFTEFLYWFHSASQFRACSLFILFAILSNIV